MTTYSHETIVRTQAQIRSGAVAPSDLVEMSLERIEVLEPSLRACVQVMEMDARRVARELTKDVRDGKFRGPLHGIPVVVKDNIDIEGLVTGAGSKVHASRIANADAEVVRRLRAAGAVILAKTTTHELAYGDLCEPTRNALDVTRLPGASSGGSAVAVASGMAPAGIGTDTGGSIRIPASFNGIVGFKPSYHRVPRSGVLPLSWTLDHVGPLARTVADAAILYRAMAEDGARHTAEIPEVIGIPTNHFLASCTEAVRLVFLKAVEVLANAGVELLDIEIPNMDLVMSAYTAILAPEASAAHVEDYKLAGQLYGSDVRTWLSVGNNVRAVDYINGLRSRHLVRKSLVQALDVHSLAAMITPTLPVTAPVVDAMSQEELGELVVRTCGPFNLSGGPALTIPCGQGPDGMPVGLTISGRPGDDGRVLSIGSLVEARLGIERTAFSQP